MEGIREIVTDWQKWLNPYGKAPVWATAAALGFCVVLAVWLRLRRQRGGNRWLLIPFLLAWSYTILCATLFGREPGSDGRVEMELFWCIRAALRTGRWQYWYFIVGNIAMFVPFGFVLEMLWKETGFDENYKRLAGFFSSAALSFFFSGAIELTQFLTKTGLCEADDLFHNTLGGILGYLMGLLITALWEARAERERNRRKRKRRQYRRV